nr:protein DOWNSTREAM OF FLC-like [Ipomoea batatas]
MATLVAFFALCSLSAAIATAHFMDTPFLVKGKVYCDTCNCGFETTATRYIPGSTVQIECRNRGTNALAYTIEGVTNSEGEYSILVESERGGDFCDVVLKQSSDPLCDVPSQGRDRARVILTRNNGITSDVRFANSMGFDTAQPLPSCPQVLQQYHLNDDNF